MTHHTSAALPSPTRERAPQPFVQLGDPVFEGSPGVRYDFNYGARVKVSGAGWRVRLLDRDAGVVLYDEAVADALVTSTKRYFVNFRIEVFRYGELVFEHDYDARGKKVYARLPESTIGDAIAWFPWVDEFRKKHQCEMHLSMGEWLWDLFADAYPDLHFVKPAEEDIEGAAFYATYFIALFYPSSDRTHQPADFRLTGLQGAAAGLLGLPARECRPRVGIRDRTRRIAEPYVCIAAQASSQAKYWNNSRGWADTVAFLKAQGYRVLCIDRDAQSPVAREGSHSPHGAEDFTGNLPLQERASLLLHADFFVGLSSGLAWLAWAVGTPVVMISGFTHPLNEFPSPYRVINYHTCNSCWNDMRVEFDQRDFQWCPYHRGTPRQFECTRLITSAQVIGAIKRLIEDSSATGLTSSTPSAVVCASA
ncbi:autotransporter strand-loop-strand O-heptosyltransferase [Paraburkholderia youngii]|uniref:autotransporter strand-loop-strand O-heptosyltransferase n=1 Tax=Paraburkholderia youngii TaxID=2782701 RepID=UPI003D251781